jgi:hypothetical protein
MSSKGYLAILLAAQVLLGLLYSLATPVFEASDEIWHYPMVREIALHRRLPVQDPAVDAAWAQEGSQPPLYYGLGALLTGWIDTSDYAANAVPNPFPQTGVPGATDNVNLVAHPPGQSPRQGGTVLAVYLIRWISVLMGTVTAYLAYRLSRTVYPGRAALALFTVALVAFNPMVLFINASVNNDNLVMVLSALGLWLFVRDVYSHVPGPRWGATALMGAVVGLAALTKVSGLVLLPFAAAAITFAAWRTDSWRAWPARGLVLLALVAAIAGWWYLRNLALYGDVTGLQRMVEIAGPRPPGFGPVQLLDEWQSFWYSYWGVFGAFNILAPRWFLWLMSGLALVAAGGLILGLVRALRTGRPPAEWMAHLLLAGFVAATFLGVLRWTLMTRASQGRLMFGAVAAISFYLALGTLAWLPRRRQPAVVAIVSASLAAMAAIVPLTVIAPAYRPPAALAALPDGITPLQVRCGDSIELMGYQLGSTSIGAGDPLDLTLYWRGRREQSENLQLSLNGYGFAGPETVEQIAKLDTWPGGGLLPTSHWQPGAIYPDHYLIPTQPTPNVPATVRTTVSWSTDLLNLTQNRTIECYVDNQPVDVVILETGTLVGPGISP